MDLSIIIPSRNEEFLDRTIQDILSNIEGDTEIIAVLDGYIPNPPLKSFDPRITVIYHPESVGQRIGSNDAAKIAKGKYIMKIDAHCAFDKGFDVKMMRLMEPDITMVPVMRNLHAFDWVCPNGHRRYQSPSGPCIECGQPTTKDVCWIAKTSPQSFSYRFDKTMHFQYWDRHGDSQHGDLTETMSIQGSCFMCTREKYFELGLSGEEFNSWGQQGVEVACKTWLSGGRVMCNRTTWYAHMFRTQGGDFSFPYHNPQSKVDENRELSRKLFQHDGWPKAIHNFQWLLDKFNPPGWGLTKGIIYYTPNDLDEKIAKPVRDQLEKISKDKVIPITSSSLKRMSFGAKNVYFPHLKKAYPTMFKQILGALENSQEDIIFFCEHDVLYSPTHFDFTPPDEKTWCYNQNVWMLRLPDGHALHFDVNQLSGLCVYRQTAIAFYKELIAKIDKEGQFDRSLIGFEPYTHNRVKWNCEGKLMTWKSAEPNIDIKHGANATGQRWKKEDYRNQSLLINWIESDSEIPGWDSTSKIVKLFQ